MKWLSKHLWKAKYWPAEPGSQQSSTCRRPGPILLQTAGRPAGGPTPHLKHTHQRLCHTRVLKGSSLGEEAVGGSYQQSLSRQWWPSLWIEPWRFPSSSYGYPGSKVKKYYIYIFFNNTNSYSKNSISAEFTENVSMLHLFYLPTDLQRATVSVSTVCYFSGCVRALPDQQRQPWWWEHTARSPNLHKPAAFLQRSTHKSSHTHKTIVSSGNLGQRDCHGTISNVPHYTVFTCKGRNSNNLMDIYYN